MERRLKGKLVSVSPKPESEKSAVVAILARHSPDIIGLCEVGTVEDLAEIQSRLKAGGVDLPYSHYTGGTDEVRHLGILSRYPVVASATPTEMEFQLNGQTMGINRGVLDITVAVNGKSYRFLGVHLKSKRESEYGDQESVRQNEARLLRRHVDSIFSKEPQARLVVYGDFNDTRSTPTLKTITGSYNSPSYLTAIPVKDSNQTAWTHHWAMADIYSRIDFVTVSASLKREVDFEHSRILDDPDWSDGSDHRPILTIFK